MKRSAWGWGLGIAGAAALGVLLAYGLAQQRPPEGSGASAPAASGTTPAEGGGAASGEASSPAADASDAAARAADTGPARFDVPEESRGPLPPSLVGTDVDGWLEVDVTGHFVPSVGARLLFDYFLSASGEEPDDVIRGRILLQISESLPPRAAREAARLLDDYLALRVALRELNDSGLAPDSFERRWQWIHELRREYLGPEASAALFSKDEDVMILEIERQRVLADPALTNDEREERSRAIDAHLPADVREAREDATAALRSREEVEALRANGAGDEEVFDAREQRFGTDAAERLAERDREQADWVGRLAAFADARDALLADTALAPEQRDAALAELRASFFTPEELPRVRALERADALRALSH